MTDMNGPKQIVPGIASVMGQNIEVIADVDPDKFPGGLEVVIFAAGSLVPLARGIVGKGCMLGVIPVEMAIHLRVLLRQAVAAQTPGQVRPPGR